MSIAVQYTIVGAILIIALVWVIVRLVKYCRGRETGGCCGCPSESTCGKKKKS